ncbi:hypothetical protein ACTHQY_08950 [Rhodococcoides corynebacterioides]|uniref:hypothetical protein n=1 Tax=Rhodococcoides corynebacterioides TaxID=53972 RepID=UPI003F7EF0B9
MAFATTQEIAAQWRPLSDEEKKAAEALLGAAYRWIKRKRPDIDDTDPDAKLVSIAVAKNALLAGEHAGYSQVSRTLGPRSFSATIANPDAALAWAKWMKDLLGISDSEHAAPRATFGDGGFRERW